MKKNTKQSTSSRSKTPPIWYYFSEYNLIKSSQANSQVFKLFADSLGNIFKQTVFIYIESEQHQIPVILFANLWHDLKWSDKRKAFYLNNRRTDIDQFDDKTDSDKE